MENNNEVQDIDANQETNAQDAVENADFKDFEWKYVSLDDMPDEEEHNSIDMILKFYENKIGNEILPKYVGRENTPEVIEDVTADVSKIFNELKSVISSRMTIKQNDEIFEIKFVEQ